VRGSDSLLDQAGEILSCPAGVVDGLEALGTGSEDGDVTARPRRSGTIGGGSCESLFDGEEFVASLSVCVGSGSG